MANKDEKNERPVLPTPFDDEPRRKKAPKPNVSTMGGHDMFADDGGDEFEPRITIKRAPDRRKNRPGEARNEYERLQQKLDGANFNDPGIFSPPSRWVVGAKRRPKLATKEEMQRVREKIEASRPPAPRSTRPVLPTPFDEEQPKTIEEAKPQGFKRIAPKVADVLPATDKVPEGKIGTMTQRPDGTLEVDLDPERMKQYAILQTKRAIDDMRAQIEALDAGTHPFSRFPLPDGRPYREFLEGVLAHLEEQLNLQEEN